MDFDLLSDGSFIVKARDSRSWAWVIVLILIGACIFCFYSEVYPPAFISMGMAFIIFFGMFGKQVLTVEKNEVRFHLDILGKKFWKKQILFEEIEEVCIAKDTNAGITSISGSKVKTTGTSLNIISDKQTIAFGGFGSKEEKEWLRDKIKQMIASS